MHRRTEDNSHNLTSELIIVEMLLIGLEDIQTPPNPRFLGLGVGSARAELFIAKKLCARSVGLVDKHDRFSLLKDELDANTHFFQADLFLFVEQLEPQSVDFVTAFGLDYVLLHTQLFGKLLQNLSGALSRGGMFLLFPSEKYYLTYDFNAFGLRVVSTKVTTCLCLQKT